MVGAFAVSELTELAGSLGVPTGADWDRGKDLVARDIVKHFEKQNSVDSLIEWLREAKPLVEWPTPEEQPMLFDPGAAPALEGAGALTVAGGELLADGDLLEDDELTAVDDGSSGSQSSGSEVAPTVIQEVPAPPSAPKRPPPIPSVRAPSPSSSRGGSSAAATVGAFRISGEADDKPTSGIDPKILVLVAALMFGAALVAFLAGLAFQDSTDDSPSAQALSASASPSGTNAEAAEAAWGKGPAGRAAQAFDRALLTVARVCENDTPKTPSAEVLAIAFDGCGPGNRQRTRRNARPRVPPPATATAEPGPDVDDRPRIVIPPSGPLEAPGSACLGGCSDNHNSCKKGCGPEPKQSSAYAEYQSCTGKCLTTYSKCRLRCQ